MTVKLYAIGLGHLTLPLAFLLADREGTIKVPVTAYLIRHPRGTVLFDTGLHPDTQTDPRDHVGDFLNAFHEFHVGAGEDVGARLESIDVDPASITHVVNSHLHFDHCGGNAQLTNAAIVVQENEWHAACEHGNPRGYVAQDFDTGQPLDLVDGERDLFGDGTVQIIPTYGHTPGHQSVVVRTETGGEFVLCGDACYLRESLANLALPGVIADRDAALASLHTLRSLRQAGATIMYGHDPDAWAATPQAPVRLG